MSPLTHKHTNRAQNRFPWRRFFGYTAVILTIFVLIRLVPAYIKEHVLFVREGHFAQRLIHNVSEAVKGQEGITAVTPDSLTPALTISCGDFYSDGRVTPLFDNTCESSNGVLLLQTPEEIPNVYRFKTLTLLDGEQITFAAQTKPTLTDTPSYTPRQSALMTASQTGELQEATWLVEGLNSTVIIPIQDEAQADPLGAILIEIEAPSGFWSGDFLVRVSTFYAPFALLLAYVAVNLRQSRRRG